MSDTTEQQRGLLGRVGGFAGRHRAPVITLGIGAILAALLLYALLNTASQPQVKQAPPVTMVVIQPPKPPPPPPPLPLPQPKMITPPKESLPEPKPMIPNQPPKAAPPKPAGPPAPSLGTAIHNNGAADSFDLSGNTGDGGVIGGGGGGGGGSYEGAVAADIEAALASNPVTRNADAGLQVRIWVNANGVVARVALDKSSGQPAVDTAIDNQILPGMQLPAPPPGTPMPMLVRLTGTPPL